MPTNKNIIRSATTMEKNRAKAVAFGSFAVVLLLTVAITMTAVALNPKTKDAPEVSTAIVFTLPVANYTSMLKGFSATELQYNETMERWESHKLVTLEAPLGSAVVATFGGTVSSVVDSSSFGRQVTIDHRDGLRTVYSNLDKNTVVKQGDRVEKGQRIGSVGQTSSYEFVSTPHVRIEVYKNGKRVDPGDYIDFPVK